MQETLAIREKFCGTWGLRILIMMLKHIAHARAEQILSPYIVATQVAHAFFGQGPRRSMLLPPTRSLVMGMVY